MKAIIVFSSETLHFNSNVSLLISGSNLLSFFQKGFWDMNGAHHGVSKTISLHQRANYVWGLEGKIEKKALETYQGQEVYLMVVQVELLTQLHWSLPHPLTAAEAQFRSHELPFRTKEIDQLRIALKVKPFF